MTFTKKVIRKRGLFLEYPVFEGADAELANAFEKRIADLAAGVSERFARCSLKTECRERGDSLVVRHFFTARNKDGASLRKTLCVTFKDGFIVKFEETRK